MLTIPKIQQSRICIALLFPSSAHSHQVEFLLFLTFLPCACRYQEGFSVHSSASELVQEEEKVPEGRTSKFISTAEREREWLPQVVGSCCLPPATPVAKTNKSALSSRLHPNHQRDTMLPPLPALATELCKVQSLLFLAQRSTASGIRATPKQTQTDRG